MSYQIKHFYSYFCWFGPHTCYQWNCRLALKFHVSRSTIKRWLRKLRDLHLIWITSGGGRYRRIHTHYYGNLLEWYAKLATPALSKKQVIPSVKEREARRQQYQRALAFFCSTPGSKMSHNIL
jgi:hypothetical protein